MESKRGLFSARAFSNASGPHGNQSTGLWACWSKYGLVSWMRRLVCCPLMISLSVLQSLSAVPAAYALFQQGHGQWPTRCVVNRYNALFQRVKKVLSESQTALSIYVGVKRRDPRVTFVTLPLYYCRMSDNLVPTSSFPASVVFLSRKGVST